MNKYNGLLIVILLQVSMSVIPSEDQKTPSFKESVRRDLKEIAPLYGTLYGALHVVESVSAVRSNIKSVFLKSRLISVNGGLFVSHLISAPIVCGGVITYNVAKEIKQMRNDIRECKKFMADKK